MENFWDFSVWGSFNVIAILLISLLAANALKRLIKPLGNSLIPTSVLGGIMLLIISSVYTGVTKEYLFDTQFFGGNGAAFLEILTYHTLALGFIASTLKTTKGKMNKERGVEIFNTGVTTVATYLLQGIFGLAITILAAYAFMPGFFEAAGILLPFGYGQGSGQAMNYGNIYETQYGFEGGKSFGLSVAALGFLSAAIGGVIHLNIIRKKGRMRRVGDEKDFIPSSEVHNEGDIPMNQGIDKITIQIALIALAYVLSYLLMYGLGLLLPTMKATVYGFNFFLGVLAAVIVKAVVNFFHKKNVIKNNFFFDIMIVAGIAAIKLDTLAQYWHILLILGVVGLVITYFYNIWVARKLFPRYSEEQFLVMYGMLTGTASTGVILLRELDPDLTTPAAENLVYQNFPAMVFGFPMMLLATFAPGQPKWTLLILVGFFLVMNIILFRGQIFRRRKKDASAPPAPPAE